MKSLEFLSFLFSISQTYSKNFIKNIQTPECKHCIHYQPHDFTFGELSPYNKCSKFGEKDIINGKIEYYIAKNCRKDEEQCGNEGKYFEKDDFSQIKQYYYLGKSYSPYVGLLIIFVLPTILKIYMEKNNFT